MLSRIFPEPLKPFFRLIAFTAIWWVAVDSYPLWKAAATAGFSPALFATLGLALVLLFEALLLLASSFTGARLFKAILVLLSAVGAGAFAFSLLFNAAMSPEMMRNALETDTREARELLTPALFGLVAAALLPPAIAAWKTLIPKRPMKPRLGSAGLALLCTALAAGSVLAGFQDISVFMREHKEVRYLIAPVNVLYSAASTMLHDQSADSVKERTPVDASPALSAAALSSPRPLILAVVVGETARAESWGLSGYERDTTPELRREGVLNFTDMASCGTATAVSLPCMMSRVGRRDYDRDRILSEEALPSLLKRAGASVAWIDNQSGCKGACEGVPTLAPAKDLSLEEKKRFCSGDECFDEALVPYVKREDGAKAPVTVLFLHMMGSHGPTYSKRYPEGFAKWKPTCDSANVQSCKAEELKNGYDNSIAYTDHTVSEMIRALREKKNADTALLYVSDHGESLGEKGLFLHGAPWMMAPAEQTRIPMVLWMSDAFKSRLSINAGCMEAAAAKPASHDNLWSTILGLTQTRSSAYDPELDLSRACRPQS